MEAFQSNKRWSCFDSLQDRWKPSAMCSNRRAYWYVEMQTQESSTLPCSTPPSDHIRWLDQRRQNSQRYWTKPLQNRNKSETKAKQNYRKTNLLGGWFSCLRKHVISVDRLSMSSNMICISLYGLLSKVFFSPYILCMQLILVYRIASKQFPSRTSCCFEFHCCRVCLRSKCWYFFER